MFPDAKGLNQSPIAINSHQAKYHHSLTTNPIEIWYDDCTQIKNTGHSFQIFFNEDSGSCKLLFFKSKFY